MKQWIEECLFICIILYRDTATGFRKHHVHLTTRTQDISMRIRRSCEIHFLCCAHPDNRYFRISCLLGADEKNRSLCSQYRRLKGSIKWLLLIQDWTDFYGCEKNSTDKIHEKKKLFSIIILIKEIEFDDDTLSLDNKTVVYEQKKTQVKFLAEYKHFTEQPNIVGINYYIV